ncbi:hypothetical protein V5O48_012900 [Marasmius crinis-equi]|uniref:BHLH domain-containing protein n=1 Tax=Marasmius crinis-equi TaxID=585013 RepID=A0ABR3F1J8_9AGAR
MSTFFSTSFKPQPHVRQEGFHLDNEGGSAGGLPATGEHHEGSGAGGSTPPPFDFGRGNVMDFTDELASLMGAASPHPSHGGGQSHQSHHGHEAGLSQSHHDNHLHGGHPGSHHESHLHGLHGHHQHQHNQSHERSTHSPSDDVSGSYRTHNIFDMGVGAPVGVSPSTTTTSHFNSTVPPLNSSMRYEQPSHSQHDYPHTANTPSPPLGVGSGNGREQSRSRSRPPTGGGSTGGVGPQRTTRTRRNNSISSTSPPPHIRPAAQAIVIPGVRHTNGGLASPLSSSATSVTNPWGFASSSPTSASEFTLPTPDSLHHPGHHHHSNSLTHNIHTPHLSSSVGFGGYFGSNDFGGGYGGHGGGQHNGGHTPSTSLPAIGGTGGIHSHLGGAGAGSGAGGGHHRTNSAAASTTAGSAAAAAASGSTPMSANEKQAMAANEKRRRRRESHNAVERRRRDNINEKISELATLIPECLLEGGTLPAGGTAGPQALLPTPNPGGDSPGASDLLSPTSPTADSDIWTSGLLSMKKEDGPDAALAGLDSPILPPGGIGGPNTTGNGSANSTNGNGSASANAAANAAGVVKANKGMILRKSVEYIRYLQQIVQEQDSRNRQLEMELRGYRERNGETLSPTLPAPAFDFQSNGASLGTTNGTGAYHGAGYAGSFRMLDSMPEDETEHRTGSGNNGNKKSRDSTPLTDDEEQGDDDDPNDPDVQPPASLKKAGVPTTKRTTRGRKAAETGVKTRRSKKNAEEDVDMGGSDEEAMEV